MTACSTASSMQKSCLLALRQSKGAHYGYKIHTSQCYSECHPDVSGCNGKQPLFSIIHFNNRDTLSCPGQGGSAIRTLQPLYDTNSAPSGTLQKAQISGRSSRHARFRHHASNARHGNRFLPGSPLPSVRTRRWSPNLDAFDNEKARR